MSRLLRCPHGHEWHTDAHGSPSACPVCSGETVFSTVIHSTPHPMNELPPSIAGYEILAEVGRGGMGIVYKARDLTRNRDVALKVILKERLANTEVLQRFRREAQAAARLSHPNIVAVYDSDQDGDTHYLAMEYVPGLTLQKLVEQSGPLAVPQACDFVRQTALGLQHAVRTGAGPPRHQAVEPDGRRSRVARCRRGRWSRCSTWAWPASTRPATFRRLLTTLTRDGSVIGTPDYIAPEQLENPHGADIRADLYSLGCTFYFLLTGQVPFPGGTLIQKLDRQRWETSAVGRSAAVRDAAGGRRRGAPAHGEASRRPLSHARRTGRRSRTTGAHRHIAGRPSAGCDPAQRGRSPAIRVWCWASASCQTDSPPSPPRRIARFACGT